jgi:hypothetical protein
LLIKKEGYKDVSLELTPQMALGPITLNQVLFDEQALQKRKRDLFYSSLGVWAVSLPLPLFLYGYHVDAAIVRNRYPWDTEPFRDFARRAEIFYSSSMATLFVTVSLFVNMIQHLLDYIRYTDEIGGR